ncbi:MAG TPA: lipoyl synthase [Myxococcota bacterium]|nr:lipoyl synthase [Myxococcota bacterium]
MPSRSLPEWFRVRVPEGPVARALERRLARSGLATVCREARCPNRGECFGHGTATVMVLGDTCTRNCRFCAVATGNPRGLLAADEPQRVATAVREAGLDYVVLTSVDRDDLPDGGAAHFGAVIAAVRAASPQARVEALIPDYRGGRLATLLAAEPDVLGHNVEVVRRLTPAVRDPRASYEGSLAVLSEARAARPAMLTKSSLMVGLGETDAEVLEVLSDLRRAGVDIVTVGQYLQPTARHWPVDRYVPPETFRDYERAARAMGFAFVASGPLVRSSYRAAELFASRRLADRAGQ